MARVIPRGWKELEIKDFLKFTPREVEKPKRAYRALGIRSHCKGTFIRQVEDPEKVMMESLYEVKKDDLIVNITFAWEGAVALVNKSDEGALVSHRFPTFVFDRSVVIPEYFRYLLPSKRFRFDLGVISPGGAGRNRVLDRKDFMHLIFVMPPAEEQKKIAQILLTWDRAIEVLDRSIEKKLHLKKGLMQKLLLGTLRFENYGSKEWHAVTLGNCCDVLDNMRKPINEQERNLVKGNIPYYGANGVVDYVKDYIFNEELILIAEDGGYFDEYETRPIAYIIKGKSWVNNHAHVLRAKSNFSQLFILYALEHKNILKYLNGGTRAKLNKGELNKIEILVPPTKEQQEHIANCFNDIDRVINTLCSMRDLIMIQKTGLIQKLLTGKNRVKI